MLLDQLVDLSHAIERNTKQVVCKAAHLSARRGIFRPEGSPYVLGILLAHVRLKQHLQRQLAGFSPCTHSAVSLQPSAFSKKYFSPASSVYRMDLVRRFCGERKSLKSRDEFCNLDSSFLARLPSSRRSPGAFADG